jgi:phosphotriesterase-related protein
VGREFSELSREQRKEVERVGRKYGVPLPHARKVADIAHTLFTTLAAVHELPPNYGKLLQAAARTHLRTGLAIASHTPDTRAAQEQLGILREEGVAPDAFIWVHAQNDWQADSRVEAAKSGAWVAIDNVAPATVDQCVERIDTLKQAGALNRLLVSHDAGWYDPAVPGGGTFRPFDTVFTALVPALQRSGWSASELRELLVANPAAAFTVRVRGRSNRP